jgi:hypothetical protein
MDLGPRTLDDLQGVDVLVGDVMNWSRKGLREATDYSATRLGSSRSSRKKSGSVNCPGIGKKVWRPDVTTG